MKFAAIQHDIVWCDRDANFEHLRVLIAEAELNGAEFVVLSETFSTGFAVDNASFAEPKGGPSSQFLAAMAREHKIWIGGTCPELSATSDDARPANTFVVVSPDGIEHRYEKIHPFTFGGEDKHVRPGNELSPLMSAIYESRYSFVTTCVLPTNFGNVLKTLTSSWFPRIGLSRAACTGCLYCRRARLKIRRT